LIFNTLLLIFETLKLIISLTNRFTPNIVKLFRIFF